MRQQKSLQKRPTRGLKLFWLPSPAHQVQLETIKEIEHRLSISYLNTGIKKKRRNMVKGVCGTAEVRTSPRVPVLTETTVPDRRLSDCELRKKHRTGTGKVFASAKVKGRSTKKIGDLGMHADLI
ncbi:hypothetical protein RUM43_006105 [Polyplax serrata]|uniref:Uncharacterized protein n=1 Tax=Polyplax serrata TaxID=468196 RepID=A0AAN8PYB1_POLSC